MLEELKAAPLDGFGRPGSPDAEDSAEIPDASTASQSLRSASFVELRNTLPTHVDLISPSVDRLMRFISRFPVTEQNSFEIELALREALANAVVHGNQQDAEKRVYVKCRCTADGEVSITVEDEGNGFDPEAVADPTSPHNRVLTHGRGIYLMRLSMDEVRFENGGTLVHMRKRPTAGRPAQRRTR